MEMGRRGSAASTTLLPVLLFFLSLTTAASSYYDQRKVYIVYLGEHLQGAQTVEEIHGHHHSFLLSVKDSEAEARESLLYSYKNSINGFAALLSPDEAARLSEMEGVVTTFPSEPSRWSLQTTRSWEFLGREEGLIGDQTERIKLSSRANYGKDIIVGLLDSGIWPESESFHDKGIGAVPSRWKGVCQEGESFNSSHCNRKLIGARYYVKGYEAHYGQLNSSYAYRSPRDGDGHGTHTASTVGGSVVHGVSALGGFANGTASGGAPLVRLAMYKVCWPIPGPNPNLENTCFDADMLAAMDDAIGDGVDILSVSIGGANRGFAQDSLAIGSLHAEKRNIVVVLSGGNSGPNFSTVSNLAPWTITVAASSIDRSFPSPVVLGNGAVIEGQSVTPYELSKKQYPLIYAGDAVVPGTAANAAGQCLPGSLDPEKVNGKIVLCLGGQGMRVAKGIEVKRAGGAAIILGNAAAGGNEILVDAHVLPGTVVASDSADAILMYIRSGTNPAATLVPAKTILDVKPSPVMAAFSSRGPNPISPQILKPDITAPGVNILAAWSESSSPTKLDGDSRRVKYNLMSGTSMSCPHVAAVAALLRSAHPDWSSAAIRSALMTTATRSDTMGRPVRNAGGEEAGPFELGAGHVRPTHASDPGLVYEASYEDYLLFACASTGAQLDPSFPCPKLPTPPTALNHPSLVVTNLAGSATVWRTVTNVGRGGESTYHVAVSNPPGFTVDVSPNTLSFRLAGEKKSFAITVRSERKKGSAAGGYVFGSYSWSDGVHEVTSPLLVGLA